MVFKVINILLQRLIIETKLAAFMVLCSGQAKRFFLFLLTLLLLIGYEAH